MIFELSLAHGCPIDCSWCAQDKIQQAYKGPRLMSWESFKEILSEAPATHTISFAGFAEPYLNPRCTDMILAARIAGYEVMLYTTCVGMNINDVERIAGVDFKPLCIHLPDREGNAKIKCTDEYVEVVKALCDAFPNAELMTMGDLHPTMSEYEPRLTKAYLHSRAGNVEGKTVQMRRRGPLKCRPAPELENNVILPDGSVVVCCNDWSMEHVLGNLLDQTWDEIHAGEPKRKLQEAMKGGECLCRTCEFADPA